MLGPETLWKMSKKTRRNNSPNEPILRFYKNIKQDAVCSFLMRNIKLVIDLKSDINSKNVSVRPICKPKPIQLYYLQVKPVSVVPVKPFTFCVENI